MRLSRNFPFLPQSPHFPEDGSDVPDGEYEKVDELGEHRRKWKKWNGKWQVKWRHRWSKRS